MLIDAPGSIVCFRSSSFKRRDGQCALIFLNAVRTSHATRGDRQSARPRLIEGIDSADCVADGRFRRILMFYGSLPPVGSRTSPTTKGTPITHPRHERWTGGWCTRSTTSPGLDVLRW